MISTMSESSGAKETPDDDEKLGPRKDLLVNIHRLTRIVLDKLEQGCKDGTLDQAQIRLLGSIGIRALGLWKETLDPRPRRNPRKLEEEVAEMVANTGYVS